jgi:hypothetical protein
LEKRRDQKAANQLCDNKFQQLSFDTMSSVFDKIFDVNIKEKKLS